MLPCCRAGYARCNKHGGWGKSWCAAQHGCVGCAACEVGAEAGCETGAERALRRWRWTTAAHRRVYVRSPGSGVSSDRRAPCSNPRRAARAVSGESGDRRERRAERAAKG